MLGMPNTATEPSVPPALYISIVSFRGASFNDSSVVCQSLSAAIVTPGRISHAKNPITANTKLNLLATFIFFTSLIVFILKIKKL